MKYIILVGLVFFASQSFAISKSKLVKLINYCNDLSIEEQHVNKYCMKLRKKGYLKKKQRTEVYDSLSSEDTVEVLGEAPYESVEEVRDGYTQGETRVILKKVKPRKRVVRKKRLVRRVRRVPRKHSTWNIYGSGSVLGNVRGLQGEISHRWQYFELGVFYRTLDRTNSDTDIKTEGENYGVSLRYHLKPLRYTWFHRTIDPALFLKLGNSRIEDNFTGEKSDYFHTTIGADFSYPLFNIGSSRLKGYSHIGIHYLHQDDFLHFGSDLGLGLLLEF